MNHKRVRRLLRTMGLMAIYPSPKTSQPAPSQKIYPYLLRGVAITQPDFVWSTDITYIRLAHGFVYLVGRLEPHGQAVAWEVMGIFRYHADGRLAEEWVQTDYRGFLQKLGASSATWGSAAESISGSS